MTRIVLLEQFEEVLVLPARSGLDVALLGRPRLGTGPREILRLGAPGLFRIDLARGFRDGDLAVSAAWRQSF